MRHEQVPKVSDELRPSEQATSRSSSGTGEVKDHKRNIISYKSKKAISSSLRAYAVFIFGRVLF
jgi:hypothetical protein